MTEEPRPGLWLPDPQGAAETEAVKRLGLPRGDLLCGCPSADGTIRHQRATCTDPVVARLDWYADDPGDTATCEQRTNKVAP